MISECVSGFSLLYREMLNFLLCNIEGIKLSICITELLNIKIHVLHLVSITIFNLKKGHKSKMKIYSSGKKLYPVNSYVLE